MEPVRESETKFTSAFVAFSFLSSFRSYYLLNSEELCPALLLLLSSLSFKQRTSWIKISRCI